MPTGILAEMTLPQVRHLAPQVVVLGVASTEPHGPALPYGTDFFQCDALCRRAVALANERGGRVLMYPTLPIGNNVNFKPFPFACRVSVRTLMHMLLEIVEALEEDGIRKIVLVNGHGGNTDTVMAVLREHFDRTPAERRAFVCIGGGMPGEEVKGLIEHPSPHAGESESSRMLYLRPDLVSAEHLQNLPIQEPSAQVTNLERTHFVRPWHLFMPASGGGINEKASAEKGRTLIEHGASGLADFLASLSQAPWYPGFPYPSKET